jgi:hypothetical protein
VGGAKNARKKWSGEMEPESRKVCHSGCEMLRRMGNRSPVTDGSHETGLPG